MSLLISLILPALSGGLLHENPVVFTAPAHHTSTTTVSVHRRRIHTNGKNFLKYTNFFIKYTLCSRKKL